MFGRLGWAEILVIVVLLVILFGSAKIPGMMKNLANGVNVFKREIKKTSPEPKPADEKKAVKPAPRKAKKPAAKRPAKKTAKK